MVRAVRKAAPTAKSASKSLLSGGSKPKRKRKVDKFKPIDITGKSLCDDVIKYLVPTLEQHKGCTLVDIYPGASVFSSKLHEFLKPKAHFMFEPNEDLYKPSIKQLLDKPGSTYHHVTADHGHRSWNWFNELPLKEITESLSNGNRQPEQFNPEVLIIANVSRLCVPAAKEIFHPLGIGLLRRFATDALGSHSFNKHGPVRVLAWMPEKYKPTLLPPTYSYGRSQLTATIEMAYNVTEVAGVEPAGQIRDLRSNVHKERKRSGQFYYMSQPHVVRQMGEMGMALPPGRDFQKNTFSSSFAKDTNAAYLSPFQGDWKTVEQFRTQLDQEEQWLAKAAPFMKMDRRTVSSREDFEDVVKSVRYPQAANSKFYPHAKTATTNTDVFAVLADRGLRILNLEAGFAAMRERGMSDADRDEFYKRIKTLNAGLQDGTANEIMRRLITDFIEDQVTFFSSSPMAAWDRRAYEPLQAKPKDFSSKDLNITLLDLMPRPIDLSVPDLAARHEVADFCVYMLKHLFSSRSLAVPAALDKTIGVNAGRDLIPMVPEITDVRKGGRLDPNNMKVRMLTPTMLEGLAKAFFEWPFKPENWQIHLAQSPAEFGAGEDGEEKAKAKKKGEDGEDEEE